MTNRSLRLMRWFYPGLGVKRWLIVCVVGTLLLVNGLNRWLIAEGLHFHVNEWLDNLVDDLFSPSYLSWIFIVGGLALIVFGTMQWLRSIIRASRLSGGDKLVDTLLQMRLSNGYNIVAIGGGTGLSTLLRGLKKYTTNLTAVVTVSDDGGSSGRLQKELGVLPPGDVRNCLVALADDEALVTDLFKYRVSEGNGLVGHSFGNLFLAAMTGITGNFDQAIKESSRVLNIKGRVLPATLAEATLRAKLADGSTIDGETNISHSTQPIIELSFVEPSVPALPEVIAAIREADAIVLGPGSLYTSIIPNLLVTGIAREIERARGIRIYICNVMTQPGETDAYSASAHVRALFKHAGARIFDSVIVNEQPPRRLLEVYAADGQVPVDADRQALGGLDVHVVGAEVISETQTVRHDPEKLAEVVLRLIDEHIAQRASFMRLAPAPPAHGIKTPARR